jgi:hypothetical protein
MVALAALTGCANTPPSQVAAPATAPANTPLMNGHPMRLVGEDPVTPEGRLLLTVRLTVYRVELPLGAASRSERLWRYFDEEVTDAATITVLQRNGFRLGRAQAAEWPAVSRVLEEMAGGAPGSSQLLAMPGRQQQVMLKEHQSVQQLFLFDRFGLLSGQDYPAGDNVLLVTCNINGQNPSEVVIQAAPAVVSEKKTIRWEQTDQGYQRAERREELPVAPLEFTIRAPRGSYVVIGPNADVMRSTSPGHSFLVSERGGLRFETLLILVPEVFTAPA